MNRDRWLESFFRPLVVALMAGCVATSLVSMVHRFLPTWNGTFLVAGCMLAVFEANYSYHLIRARQLQVDDILQFRAVELLTFFILIKAGSYIGDRWASILADIMSWPANPFEILDPETIVAFAAVLSSWWSATSTIRDLEHIGEIPEPHGLYVPPKLRLASRFLWGGWALLIFAGVANIGVGRSMPRLVLNVLLYFLLGIAMLGQFQFATLHARWQSQKTAIDQPLGSRWARYGLLLLGLATLLAFLLPTDYTVGLLDLAGNLLQWVAWGMMFILAWIMYIVAWLGWLLLGRPPPTKPDLTATPPPEQPLGDSTSGGGTNWLLVLRSLVFWMLMLGMVYYVIRSYLRDHPEIARLLTEMKLVQALRSLWASLWRNLFGLAHAIKERLPEPLSVRRRRERRRPPREPLRFFRLGALSARERVRYYYLSLLKRAGQKGFPRQRTQTPYEYHAVLEPHLSEAQQELSQITEAFVEARYSAHAIERSQEQQARRTWQQVKAALRALGAKKAASVGGEQEE